MTKSVFQSQLEDEEALRGLREAESMLPELPSEERAGSVSFAEAVERVRTGRADLFAPQPTEAIVMLYGYPSLLVSNGKYEEPVNSVWKSRLKPNRSKIEKVIASAARVDLEGHPDYRFVGSAWRISEDCFITNRHVASVFADAKRNGHVVRRGIKVKLDFAEEHGNPDQIEEFISAIHHIEDKPGIDMAILRVDEVTADKIGKPLELLEDVSPELIGVVGYPARDFRNPEDAMNRIFGGVFNVKRFAPGRVMDFDYSSDVLTHNCTTLGGNSGSVVFDIASGCAVGLHFAGSAREANYAAKASAVADVLRKKSVSFASSGVAARDGSPPDDEDTVSETALSDRAGYDPNFIGTGNLAVPLPQLNCLQQRKLARTKDGEEVLRYQHFSVVQNAERKLAFFAACNVDGSSLRRPRRPGFRIDSRLEREHQAGNELYKHNDLDRGHLIRRLDPCWGTSEAAEDANRDSMFYTNIGPQHKDLNQKVWKDLEDHILDRTDEDDARISVFVGCLFGDNDPPHKATGIKVPMGFWKIIASVGRVRRGRSNRRVLQAQAFVLFQDHLVKEDDLEIIFGAGFETHQVTVEELERMTGLDFHVLRDADTFGLPPEMRESRIAEAAASTETPYRPREQAMKPLGSLDDIVLG